MGRAVLLDCLPWAVGLVLAVAAAWLVIRLNAARPRFGRLFELHRNQGGSAQSLSFVLTLPFFVMILLFIVQVSQLMIAEVVVHYAAYAAARAASVWIPADVGSVETANCISSYSVTSQGEASSGSLDSASTADGEAGGTFYRIQDGGLKYAKIESAAVMACLPICPSRDTGASLDGRGAVAADIIERTYAALSPQSQSNSAIPRRIRNKVAYAMANTRIEMRFFHKDSEPLLAEHRIPADAAEFRYNELGWQDYIKVTVHHDLALLPGPGRLLARAVYGSGGQSDEVSQRVERSGSVYTYPLSASIAMGNEGEKSVIPYVYEVY